MKKKGYSITCIRSDHGGEFENHAFESFCNDFGIEHQFSSPRTPQLNGVVERKNRHIQKMARTMLNENSLSKYFWAEAVNTACYVLNRVLIRPNLNKTPYELWKDRKPNIDYFKVFGYKCFVLNTKDNLGKFDPKSDVGIFLGYSNSSKVYRVYNKRTLVLEESMHVTFDESNLSSTEKVVVDDNTEEEQQEEASNDNQKGALHGIQEEHHEETNAEQNEGTKWVFRNKMDESGVVVRNKARLVAQGYNQEEGIDFDETFAPVASTPMSTTIKLDEDEKGKEVDIKTYRGMIGSLLYLTANRPDIMFSVYLCARFQSCPKESHMLVVKQNFRYLIGTINLSLWYPRGTHIDLTCYSDADFAGYKVDRKSTSGTCHFLGHSHVSWFSKKQNSVALSTTEAEYIATVLPHNRLTGSSNPESRIREAMFCLKTGQPVIQTASFHFKSLQINMSSSRLVRRKGKESVQQTNRSRQAGGTSNQSNFESTHFQNKKHLVKRFQQSFRTREVLNTFYVLPDWLNTLNISHRNLFQLLGDVGWIDALMIEENLYPDLLKVFYSNMDVSAENKTRVITNVGGVMIDFDFSLLNSILGSSDFGLEIYSPRKSPNLESCVHIDAVRNICRRDDLSDEDWHLDEVSHMDVALIDCILRRRPVNLGYTIIRTMLTIPALITRSLPYSHFITRILKYFDVPIQEPPCRPSKGIGDDAIFGLGFEWKNGTWVKFTENKFTFLAPSDDQPLNAVVPADQLPVFSLSFRGQRRRRDPHVIASAPGASASASSPPQPPTSEEVTLQQLMDEVRTLSVRQIEFQHHSFMDNTFFFSTLAFHIRCKWIYKRKRGVDERVETFKARLVAKGFTQKEGIDYEETFSLVAMLKSIKILLSIAAVLDYEIWQMDVKIAFLNGYLEEDIYMQQPDGFIQKGQEHMVYKDSRKSTSGYVFTLGSGAISWRSVKQSCIADSTTEAEYVAASEAAKEAVWLRKFLQDLEVVPAVTAPLKLFCDNSGAVAQSKELRNHKKQKHIERKYHLIRDIVQRSDVEVSHIASQQNLADPFTKAIPGKPFNLHLESMGMREMPNML
ncbi:Integrase catalytic domain-containing protein [Citrus sinensis]|uniref:Integrase catalytic domain-containing protein n=1 Tax=Citrus sinensis TaxID=2711 RepID=A0ACB8KFT5_CITSI|nr:Integrase catalytic domain-containing protein [Citrus sinensis]